MKLEDTVKGFAEILEGKHDALPEQAFYMVGTMDDAVAKAKTLGGADEVATEAEEAAEAEEEAKAEEAETATV